MIRLGLDIDGTITAHPAYFTKLARDVKKGGGKVYIITNRPQDSRPATEAYLRALGLPYDQLFMRPPDRFFAHDWKPDYFVALKLHAVAEDDTEVLARAPPSIAKLYVSP